MFEALSIRLSVKLEAETAYFMGTWGFENGYGKRV